MGFDLVIGLHFSVVSKLVLASAGYSIILFIV